MSDGSFDAGPVWDAAAPRLFPGQTVRWENGWAVVRCVLGCPHKNGDARPSLRLQRKGNFRCLAFGREGSLKELVLQVLGAEAWAELGKLGAGAGGKPESLDAVLARLDPEKGWTTRFGITPELSGRFLRAGKRWPGDLAIEHHVLVYDALGRLAGIKSRRPEGKLWTNGTDREAKYRHTRGSKAAGLLFVTRPLAAHPAAAILVCAGEKDAIVAASHLPADRWLPVSGVAGEASVPPALAEACAGRRVVIAYDPDPAGRAGAAKVWRALRGKAADLRVAMFPEGDGPAGEGKWDVAAVVLDGGVMALREGEPSPGGAKLAAILEAAVPELPDGWALEGPSGAGGDRPPRREAQEEDGGKPRIYVQPPLKTLVDQGLAALTAAGVDVYQRGGQLVRVVRASEAAHIAQLPEPTLLETLSDVAVWVKRGEENDRQVDPPRDVVRAMAARSGWAGVRLLEGVVRGPVLRLDGTVLDAPGYDPATALLFEPLPGVEWPRVADRPTKEEALAALARLADLVADFPFVAASDRSAWLALVLTLVARPAIAGPTPLFLVRAPTPGSGKTLLVEVAGLIGTEAEKLTTQPQVVDDDAEEQKKLLTFGLQGIPLALIDNIDRPLGSAALASALTSRRVGGRLLGSNTHIEVPVPVMAATGNNVVVRADLARRVVPIDLDPGVERPEERTGFRIGNLATYAREHRAELRIAALTALRWYCAEGRPAAPCRALGSYTEWTDLIRQTLIWLGQPDPCLGMDRVRESGDVEVESVRGVLSMWWTLWGDADKTALDVAMGCGEELRDLLIGLGGGKNDRLEARKLGYVLRRLAGRVMGGYRLERRPGHQSIVRWRVVNLARPPAPDGKAAGGGEREERPAPASPGPSWVDEGAAQEQGGEVDGWEFGRE